MNLARAIEIAASAHRNQVDKGGSPYILHPIRVMMSLNSEDEKIVGVLQKKGYQRKRKRFGKETIRGFVGLKLKHFRDDDMPF